MLDSEPDRIWNKCPFSIDDDCRFISVQSPVDGKITYDKCKCIGGYYDSLTFDFEKCPFCRTFTETLKFK